MTATTSNSAADAAEVGLADALGLLATTPRLLVALDFDGTLAPEVDDPGAARALPEANEAIRRLVALPDTSVALVSGRSLESLLEVSDVPDSVLLIGSHGVEYRIDATSDTVLTADERAGRERLAAIVHEIAADDDSVRVEEKPAGVVLHTRLASAAVAADVQEAARRRVAAALPQVTERSGKNVVEFSVRATTKADGLARLREATRATGTFFAGDDVTDEDGFAALGEHDLGLKCGRGETRARYRVAAPDEVARVVADLAELRRHLGRTPSATMPGATTPKP